MNRHSELCRDCFNETRLLDAQVRIEVVPGQKRVVLADLKPGRIVKVDKRWGVLLPGGDGGRRRSVDFWDGGRESVSNIAIVEAAPAKRLLVGGIEEEAEEIAA